MASTVLQIIRRVLILLCLEPAGAVNDVTLLVHCSACSYLRKILQQSPTVYAAGLLLILQTPK